MTNFAKIEDMPSLIVATVKGDRDAMLAWLRLSGEVTATMTDEQKDEHTAEWFDGAETIAGDGLAMKLQSFRNNYVNKAQAIVERIGMLNGEVVPGRAAEFLTEAWDCGELKRTSLQTVAAWLAERSDNATADDVADEADEATDVADEATDDADPLSVILSLIPHLSADDTVLAFAALEAHADAQARNHIPTAERIYVTA